MSVLKRQFITDTEGNTIGVILPAEEYKLVADILDRRTSSSLDSDKLVQMEQAAQDPLFLADSQETMSQFAETDAEWWEPNE